MLKFEDKNGVMHDVKERTQKQIYKCLSSYMTPAEIAKYQYKGNQRISINNGNIYADFTDINGFIHTFYIADYNDYINEIINEINK